jgi:cytochrome c-type biogenesis protein CcmH
VTPALDPSPRGGGDSAGLWRRRRDNLQRHPREGGDPRHVSAWARSRPFAALAFFLFLAGAWAPAHAVQPDEILKDPALEARARHISQELRCLVCQNQSIDDSNAELARDLRLLVRERLSAGDSDAAVLAFVEDRYGEFALLRPRFSAHTLLLWLTPLLLLAGAAVAILRHTRRRLSPTGTAPQPAPLSPDEQQRLEALLKRTQD